MRFGVGVCAAMLTGCFGAGGSSPDAGDRFEIAALTPTGGAPFWRHSPIEAEFSAPLDPATVDASSVVVTVDGVEVERTMTLTGDDTTIVIDLAAMPPVGSTVVLAFGDGIRSVTGQPYLDGARSWPVPAWISDRLADLGDAPMTTPSLSLDESGHPIMSTTGAEDPTTVSVWRWNWRAARFDADAVNPQMKWTERTEHDVVVDTLDRPVYAWTNEHGVWQEYWYYILKAERLDIAAFDFTVLPEEDMLDALNDFQLYRHGDTILRATLRYALTLRICELSSDDTWVPCYPSPITTTIHATRFQLASVGDRLAAVIRTDGPDTNLGVWILEDGSWTRLSTSLGTNHAPTLNDVVTHEGALYVGYQATGALHVDRVDAETGEATPLGPVSDAPAGTITDGLALGIDADGTLYAAWAETDETDAIDVLHLARWTGDAWEPMDLPEDPRAGEPIDSVRLEVDPFGNPIVVYGGAPTGGLVRTARYNGY